MNSGDVETSFSREAPASQQTWAHAARPSKGEPFVLCAVGAEGEASSPRETRVHDCGVACPPASHLRPSPLPPRTPLALVHRGSRGARCRSDSQLSARLGLTHMRISFQTRQTSLRQILNHAGKFLREISRRFSSITPDMGAHDADRRLVDSNSAAAERVFSLLKLMFGDT